MKTTMTKPCILLFVTVAIFLAGCEKSACDRGSTAKAGFPWSRHLDLVPQAAQVCGAVASRQNTLRVSFPEDPNPWVTAVKHLEALGFVRTHQDIKSRTLQFADFKQKDLTLHLMVSKLSGEQWSGELTLSSPACSNAAKDGSACRDGKQVVQCQHSVVLADKQTCGEDESCQTNKSAGALERAASAHCRGSSLATASAAHAAIPASAASAVKRDDGASGPASKAECAALDDLVNWLFKKLDRGSSASSRIQARLGPTIKRRVLEHCVAERWAASDVRCVSEVAKSGDTSRNCPRTADVIGRDVMRIMSTSFKKAHGTIRARPARSQRRVTRAGAGRSNPPPRPPRTVSDNY